MNSLPCIYYPAKLIGWTASCSEYDLFLDKPQDLFPTTNGTETERKKKKLARLVENVLWRLEWDDRIDVESSHLVVSSSRDGGADEEEEEILSLATFLEQDQSSQIRYPSRILRIERIWDKIPLFNPSISLCT